MDCLFCKIISGEVPSSKVYEDDKVLAFLTIAPNNYGHTLVIPKEHFENLEDIPEEILSEVIKAVKKVGLGVKNGMNVEGYNVNVNNGTVAGQLIPHLHFHVIPRHENDNFEIWPQGKYGDGEKDETADKIKKEII